MDPRKIEAVVNREQPKNVSKVRSFLDFAGYYRRFVEHFSLSAAPLTQLTRKGVKYEWNDECEQSFQELKSLLTMAPVLVLPTLGVEYVVFSDASRQ